VSAPEGPGPPVTEEQMRDDLVRLDLYRNQLTQMLQQHQLLQASRSDHLRARESLDGLDRSGPETEILIPVGGETFVRGLPRNAERVLIGIGSGIVVEMDRPKAAELLAQRLTRLDQAAQDLESQMRALEERISLLSNRLDALTQGPDAEGRAASGYDVGVD
jgi:prefoldin alpha subunit